MKKSDFDLKLKLNGKVDLGIKLTRALPGMSMLMILPLN